MKFSRFFVDRPVFAAVLSLLIFIAGLMAIWGSPISEYPEVVPPSVEVRAYYPGASPETMATTVASLIEEQLNGLDGMLYMFSQASANGEMVLRVTFKIGTDPDTAQQLVQNRVNQALPRLPEVVRQIGVTTLKSAVDLTMVVHILSPRERYDTLYLGNFATLNIKDSLTRVSGVGHVMNFGGSNYAMRIWLDPDKVAARGLIASEVVNAIREQNVQVAPGVIGDPPAQPGLDMQWNVTTQGRLRSPEEFGEIIIKTSEAGTLTRLKEVARVELGAEFYSMRSLLNNHSAVALGIFQSPDANTLEVAKQVKKTMKALSKDFPEDIEYAIIYDPTAFIHDSIQAVLKTLLEAILLVVLVVILFLQTWRASIIPLLAVPVSIVGTVAVLFLFDFSINALTLFGLVLAIGIVVDDAIVVVENVERNIRAGLTPKEATYQAMEEVSGPIIAIGLTLVAVFIPIAFITGLNGEFYRQFALTIAVSTVISAFNSLTLSPAMAALLLKDRSAPQDALTLWMHKWLGSFFALFNRFFKQGIDRYQTAMGWVLSRKTLAMMIYCMLIGLTMYGFSKVPTGYIPAQDKQYLIGFAQLPDGASLDRTEKVVRRMSDIILKTEGVEDAVAFPGLSIHNFSISPSAGIIFVTLKPFNDRKTKALNAQGIAQNLNVQLASIKDAFVMVLPPPPILGLGTTGGFKLQLEDRADLGNEALFSAVQEIQMKAWQNPLLMNVFSGYQINVPQLYVDIDRAKVNQAGVRLKDVFETLQIYLGSLYVNDFNKFGKTYQVIAQADLGFRAKAQDITRLQVRNIQGEMIPLAAFLKIQESFGPERAMRYNGYRTAEINGEPAPGVSSGQAQAAIEKIVKETLPKGMAYEWTDLVYQKILAGNSALFVFPLCVLLVFLVLAAQYESVTLPFVIILIVPMSLLCAIVGVWLSGGDNNIFTQIGLFVLVGLACKNAILIVEFALKLEQQGCTPLVAAVKAATLRLRPILMTSFAFIMGVLPLTLATGAASEMRRAMGVAVFSGMLGVTFFGLFLTPVFYVALRGIVKRYSHANKNVTLAASSSS